MRGSRGSARRAKRGGRGRGVLDKGNLAGAFLNPAGKNGKILQTEVTVTPFSAPPSLRRFAVFWPTQGSSALAIRKRG